MKNEKQIIAELKSYINRSKPFRFYTPVIGLLNELEVLITPTEEVISSEVDEELIIEEFSVITPEETEFSIVDVMEEPVVEESPITEEPVVAKKTTKKK